MTDVFVLDTDICVDLHRAFAPSVDLVAHLESQGPLAVTSITVAELVQGAYRASEPEKEVAVLRRLLSAFEVLDLDGATGWIAGRLAAQLQREGTAIGDLDTLIAACVIAHGARLVTRNAKHFSRVRGLDVVYAQ